MTGGQIKTGQQQRCGWLSITLEVTSNGSSWTQLLKDRSKNQKNLKTFGFSIFYFVHLIMLNTVFKSQQEQQVNKHDMQIRYLKIMLFLLLSKTTIPFSFTRLLTLNP